ncbi:hypothetical protein AX17_007424 [Amanita inopinata Kibby_2008]|nr:hypothetical protein AX17_007424 [Amanita inopinata Kibby_2008]
MTLSFMAMSSFSESSGSLSPVSDLDTTIANSNDNAPERDAGVGLSNPGLNQTRRKMLDLVNRLHSTGVQVDIDLPQIAVIGSQSAGKSSLIESISGITLPRAAGTCTRCPTECRLSQMNKPWQCIVSLRFITDAHGQPLGQARNEIFGPVITKKSEVEERIRRAQRAVLNPSKPRRDFLDGEDADIFGPELSFSNNCVSLQISGPDVADLSFCDLPGLIASVGGGGNASDIDLVESLVTSYIKKPSCIILLTVACETDFENQGAHRLAKQFDPEGKRTIGVLTKPDRIPAGEESSWIPFIKNEKEPLENNWYCVKQPNSNDLKAGITWRDARRREDEFFSMTAPWSDLETVYQKFLRTSNLVECLSTVLSDLILKRLPEIQDELERSIAKAQHQLNNMPKEPSNDPIGEIMNLIHRFTIDVSRHAEGVSQADGLLQAIRPAQQRFRRAIKETSPEFRPFSRNSGKEISKPRFLSAEEGSKDSGSEGEGASSILPKRKKRENPFIYYLDEVMQRAQQAQTRELPGNYPFVVQTEYIRASTQHWDIPAHELCRTVHNTLVNHMKNLVHLHFTSFGSGALEQRVKVLIQEHLRKCMERAEERIRWLLELEEWPATLNTHYLSDYKDKFFAHYKGARAKDRNPELDQIISTYMPQQSSSSFSRTNASTSPTGIAKVLQGLVDINVTGVKPEDIPKILPPDPMEPGLVIMADVRAYFQVAYKRFADNVPNAVDVELIRGVERDLLQVLYAGIGIHGRDGRQICRELSKEHPTTAHKRAELKKKLERLKTASHELLSIGR